MEALIVVFLVGFFGVLLYFLPTVIAFERGHDNRIPLMILNIFFGWTMLGWVGCLAWAFARQPEAWPDEGNTPYNQGAAG